MTEKLPTLDPAEIGMTALNLYQQLYQLLRLAGAPLADTEAVGMDQLWKIALRANNTGERSGLLDGGGWEMGADGEMGEAEGRREG